MNRLRELLMVLSGITFVYLCLFKWRDNSAINLIYSIMDKNIIFGAIGAGFLFMCGGALCFIFFELFDMITKK